MTVRVFPDPFPPACATAWGDDRYGLWCEITVKGVVQRLRWIEPGAFWMGSTEEERLSLGAGPEDWWRTAIKKEAPRHQVRLTEGFWLADTPCTQAMWMVFATENPSHTKGEPDLPVDRVSWDDVTAYFLPALGRQLAGVEVLLPTEAQWEYACRAGTRSAYHFGETIAPQQANFASKRSVPVKALPPNAWGMFQMHGNVGEWCADAPRQYGEEHATDPDGGRVSADRAVRGGSWGSEAWGNRSASRSDLPRDSRFIDTGFRFVLQSVEPTMSGFTNRPEG
ncbi:formylglycine-generating enzyme family protein [Sphaerotilus montanus]|uniref:formylglycine-generating enzyme family protein n=1 Tax=Sphaerotilus montanus TaxID=522889 RepID=UPI003FA2BD47